MNGLQVWHLTPDAHRRPRRVSAGERVLLEIGTWPIAPGQRAWITWWSSGDEVSIERCTDATWTRNEGENSYWSISIGPFRQGDIVEYAVCASDELSEVVGPRQRFRVGPKIHLALMWHQHQPMYRLEAPPSGPALVQQPWVRLHALRDYYSMAALVAEHPDLHVTFNLTPVLLAQLDDYVAGRATDRALTLTLTPADQLTAEQMEELLGSFFDADWHEQIFVHSRYRALFEQRVRGDAFSTPDLRDLQMWFNLAWFGKEFRDAPVKLATGETVAVHRFVERGAGFSTADVREMVDDQYKIMRAVVPIHRAMQDRGQIEVTTTPFYHPILPLVMDTDQATVDLDGATLPRRFAYPEDAEAQVQRAALDYVSRFGRPPLGMWPAEGAVSGSSIPLYVANGIRWIATDRGVLARSGLWGFNVEDADVACQPYLVSEADAKLAVFFRDTSLSDAIGFRYAHTDPDVAAAQFLREIEERFVSRFAHDEDRLVTVILDGENAWGAYAEDGRPFLRALYTRLANTPSIQTVTFSEYLGGNLKRGVVPHVPTSTLQPLFTGSWIDEMRSRPGVDLGTWIGEPEENRAWELLGHARRMTDSAQPPLRERALESAYAAEGSDWFWWFGNDQDSGNDPEFDALFRAHLRAVYGALRLDPPADLLIPLVAPSVVWTFAQPLASVAPGDQIFIRTNCPGTLVWRVDDGPEQTAGLQPVGGVLAGARRFEIPLGAIAAAARTIRFRFLCEHERCACHDTCCRAELQTVTLRAGTGLQLGHV